MSADDEDRPDLGGPEEELQRMSSQRRGARSIGREQAIPILFVVVAVVLLLWWIIGLRPNPSPVAVAPTSTLSATAVATPVVTLTLATPTVITDTTGMVVAVGTAGPSTPEPGTPVSSGLREGMSVKVSGTGSDQLSLRGGPGVNNARLTLLPDGTMLKVVGGPEEGSCGATEPCRWWRLQMADGTVGWAVESNLVPVEP